MLADFFSFYLSPFFQKDNKILIISFL